MSMLLMIGLIFGIGAVPCAYAESAPTQSITIYPRDASRRNIPAYSDSTCTKKIGTIYGTDKCTILACYGNVLYLQYPTSKSTRKAYAKTEDFTLGNFSSVQTATANASAAVYRYETGSSKLGTMYQNDKIYILYSGSNRSQIIYPVSGNQWKCGWIDWVPQKSGNGSISDGYYYIATAMDSNKVGDVWGGTAGYGTNFQLYTKKSDSSSANQIFHIVHVADGWYKILCSSDERFCVELYGGRVTEDQHNVAIWEYHGGDGQLWKFNKCDDGSYIIENKAGLVMDLERGSLTDESNIIVYRRKNVENQKWWVTNAAAQSTQTAGSSLTNALYGINSSKSLITCGYDGYVNTKGKHEGIDFKLGSGKPVYSLVNGTITGLKRGSSSSLSSVAIYDSTHNLTFVVLHSKPLSGLYVGQSISVGQQLATEDKRGASSVHTHIEIRPGKKTGAAKSVNDYTLENPNPTPLYQQLGYQVW